MAGNLAEFVKGFLKRWCGSAGVPFWAVEALASVGIDVSACAAKEYKQKAGNCEKEEEKGEKNVSEGKGK